MDFISEIILSLRQGERLSFAIVEDYGYKELRVNLSYRPKNLDSPGLCLDLCFDLTQPNQNEVIHADLRNHLELFRSQVKKHNV